MIKPIVLDFETMPIKQRPEYPPEPTSFSLKLPEWRSPHWFGWGQRTGGNNCDKISAHQYLKAAFKRISATNPILCHHTKFDLEVAFAHFDLPIPPWHDCHDTMFLLFLEDPHQRELGLKPSASRLLNIPQTERDIVEDWILDHKAQLERDFPEILEYDPNPKTGKGGIKPSNAGAFIGYAPGEIVGSYANGDVSRTLKIFSKLHERITVERGMGKAYDRERQFMPIILKNEQEGIRVDVKALERDQPVYEKAQVIVDDWLRKALKAPTLDFDKDQQVANALEAADAVSEWTTTPTGRLSVSKKNLKLSHFSNQKIGAAYSYRQKCATILETFIRPWQRHQRNGWMHTTWNQVRQAKGDDTGGTRTGRPSSDSPNFLNMPKKVKEGGVSEYKFPAHISGAVELPRVRSYILPDERGHVIGRRDFNQQELRILAHYEDGPLYQAYLTDPRLDVHEFVRAAIETILMDIGREPTKTLNFGYIYGMGMPALAAKFGKSIDEVKQIRNAQMSAMPGLKALSDLIKSRAKAGKPIVTWGGREYFCEPPRVIDNRLWSFEYKLLNYLIQGSAADITKESIIRYMALRKEGRFILTVYDENNISIAKSALKAEMLRLREAMMSIELDVPLLSDGEWGPNLGNLEKLIEPAPSLAAWA